MMCTVFQTVAYYLFINPETSSRVTLASLGTVFLTDLVVLWSDKNTQGRKPFFILHSSFERIMHYELCIMNLKKVYRRHVTFDTPFFYSVITFSLARSDTRALNCFVDATCHAKQEDTCGADCKSKTCVAIALESRERILCLVDEHSLNDKEIVVE